MSFMSLMADYVRVHLVVASITERKQALGMYYCAYSTVNGKKTTPAMSKVAAVCSCCLVSKRLDDYGSVNDSIVLCFSALPRSCCASMLSSFAEMCEVLL